jgi:hypothetical protein
MYFKLERSLTGWVQEDRRRGSEYTIIHVAKYGTNYTWDFQPFLTAKYKCQILSYTYSNE